MGGGGRGEVTFEYYNSGPQERKHETSIENVSSRPLRASRQALYYCVLFFLSFCFFPLFLVCVFFVPCGHIRPVIGYCRLNRVNSVLSLNSVPINEFMNEINEINE